MGWRRWRSVGRRLASKWALTVVDRRGGACADCERPALVKRTRVEAGVLAEGEGEVKGGRSQVAVCAR